MTEPADERTWQELRDQLRGLQERIEQLEDIVSQNIFEIDESEPTPEIPQDVQEKVEAPAPKITLPPKPAILEQGMKPEPWQRTLLAANKLPSQFSFNESWESIVGGRWLTWLGSGSLVLAMLYFAFWAWHHFDTPAWVRVSLFHLIGLGILGAAHWLNQKKLPRLANGLAGVGVFTLYVAAYFIHHRYHLWGDYSATMAFIDCILITCVTIFIALNASSVAIILLGALGGYLTPFLSQLSEASYITTFIYLAFLNIALITCSTLRPWQFLKPIVVAATAIMFLVWIESSGSTAATNWSTEWLLTLHASIVLLGTTLPPILWRQRSTGPDLLALVTNSLWFVGATWLLFHRQAEQQMAAVCFGMSALHLGLFGWTLKRVTNLDRMPRYQLALATMFFTLAIPLQLQDSLEYLAYAWAVEGIAFAAIAVYFRDKQMAGSSHLVLALALIRTFAFDFTAQPETIGALALDRRFLVLFCTGLAIMAAGSCYWWVRRFAPPREATPLSKNDGGILLAIGNIVVLVSLTCQWDSRIILVLWTLDAAVVWLAAFRSKHLAARGYAFLLSTLMVGWRVYYHGDSVERPFQLLLNERFASLVLVAIVYFTAGWWQRRILPSLSETEYERQVGIAWALHCLGNIVLISAITMEVHYWYQPTGNWSKPFSMAEQVSHSVLWSVYAAILVAIGFALKYPLPRMLGLIALLAVALKVFFIDLSSLSLILRVLALSILGVMLLTTSFWYQKFTARIESEEL